MASAPLRVTVSDEDIFSEQLQLYNGDELENVTVRISYDEDVNQLSIALLSKSRLFVFHDTVAYNRIVKSNIFGHATQLVPEKLPYQIETESGSRYRVTKQYKKSLQQPSKKHIFSPWISTTDLNPVDCALKMVNDSVEAVYTLPNREDSLFFVSLNDVSFIQHSLKSKPGHKTYDLSAWANLDRTYDIKVKRNPCFGMDTKISKAETKKDEVKAKYEEINKRLNGRTTTSSADFATAFATLRDTALKELKKNQSRSLCVDLNEEIDAYNAYIDSIAALNITYVPDERIIAASQPKPKEIDAAYLYKTAREIDEDVARFIVASDPMERLDIKARCKNRIQAANAAIKDATAANSTQSQALNTFRQAEAYFKKKCQ